ncbi:hypothetical protein [Kitasatospora sp. NPDC088134]|uniref:hypothetical protein n=1 Tax=Kitasatospora sp. NPDC088134 TaxID=3364071 RepID=UPI003805DC32
MIASESGMRTGGAVEQWTGVRELADGQCLMVVPLAQGAEVLRWVRGMGLRDLPVLLMPPSIGERSIGRLAFPALHAPATELAGARTVGAFAFPLAPVAVDLADLVGRPVEVMHWLVAPGEPVQLWNPDLLAGALKTAREQQHERAAPPHDAGQEWALLRQALDGARW